jgi:hypothetical protein
LISPPGFKRNAFIDFFASRKLMLRLFTPTALTLVVALLAAPSHAAEGDETPAYDLTARIKGGDVAAMITTLEVGGELVLPEEAGKDARLPLSVAAKLAFIEQMIAWTPDVESAARSVRKYSTAEVNIKTDKTSEHKTLPEEHQVIAAELSDAGLALRSLAAPLTRDEYNLVKMEGNTLALDRLLPGRELREGEGWDHDATAVGAFLGMDHVAVCEVRSVVTGEDQRQVQIRMAGTVHGAVDGAATEMELRAAYLYHLDRGRITKMNLAIKERRKPGDVSPGLDVVAKLAVIVAPVPAADLPAFSADAIKQVTSMSRAELRQLVVDAPPRGYRFLHDLGWFVTAEHRELMSLKLLDEGDSLAHCNVTTAPPRPADKPLALPEFEREVCKSLGDKVGKVAAATEWKTPAGHRCLAVFVDGTIKSADGLGDDVAVQWRYYNLSAPGMAQATISVTVEQAVLERFADADRPLVDSLELMPLTAKTAAAEGPTAK